MAKDFGLEERLLIQQKNFRKREEELNRSAGKSSCYIISINY
jgi:hypothetical protein